MYRRYTLLWTALSMWPTWELTEEWVVDYNNTRRKITLLSIAKDDQHKAGIQASSTRYWTKGGVPRIDLWPQSVVRGLLHPSANKPSRLSAGGKHPMSSDSTVCEIYHSTLTKLTANTQRTKYALAALSLSPSLSLRQNYICDGDIRLAVENICKLKLVHLLGERIGHTVQLQQLSHFRYFSDDRESPSRPNMEMYWRSMSCMTLSRRS